MKRKQNAGFTMIEMITAAPDAASARASLQVHLDLSERQADAVLAMPLRRLLHDHINDFISQTLCCSPLGSTSKRATNDDSACTNKR